MKFLKIVFLLAVSLNLTSCSNLERISISYHTWLGYVVPFLGETDKKYSNIKYFQTNSATSTMQMLLDGTIDGGYLTLDEALQVKDKGIDLKVVLVTDTSVGADTVLAQPHIKTREQIIGSKVAYEASALGQLMLYHFLQHYQIDKSQVKLISMGLSNQVMAFKRKQIDIAISYFPEAWQISNLNAHELFSSRDIPNTILDVLVMRSEVLKTKSKSACQAVYAHLDGLKQIRNNITDSKYKLASMMDTTGEKIMENLAKISLPSAELNYSLLKKDGDLTAVAERLNHILNDANITQNTGLNKNITSDQCVMDYLEHT